MVGSGLALFSSIETSSVMEPHSNLCWQLAEIAITLLVSLLFKPVTTDYMLLVSVFVYQ